MGSGEIPYNGEDTMPMEPIDALDFGPDASVHSYNELLAKFRSINKRIGKLILSGVDIDSDSVTILEEKSRLVGIELTKAKKQEEI